VSIQSVKISGKLHFLIPKQQRSTMKHNLTICAILLATFTGCGDQKVNTEDEAQKLMQTSRA
jgi:hypothetical protein